MATSFSRSPEVGGRDRDRRAPASETDKSRPRREPGGFLGSDDDNRDPTRTDGLLDRAFTAIAEDPFPRPVAREIGGSRESRPAEKGPSDEEEVILPGDPNDLGARGRRRRREDDDTPSPVLRRGLLGV